MRALILDCTSAVAPDPDVEIVTKAMVESFQRFEVEVETLRILDADLDDPVNAAGAAAGDDGDAEVAAAADGEAAGSAERWARFRDQVLGADILLLASPATWLGQPSDEARRVLEGMSRLLAGRDGGQAPAVNHVAGVVVAGDRLGGEMVLSEVTAALTQLGFTVPGQATTYLSAEALVDGTAAVRDQAAQPAREAAANLVAVARALHEHPIPPLDAEPVDPTAAWADVKTAADADEEPAADRDGHEHEPAAAGTPAPVTPAAGTAEAPTGTATPDADTAKAPAALSR